MNGDAVNETLRQLYERKSVRAYTNRTITAEEKNAIIAAVPGSVSGGIIKTIETKDGSGNPVPQCLVFTTSDQAGRVPVSGFYYSDAAGVATCLLPRGTQWIQRLKAGYAAHPERDYFVLQGHPAMWGEERFAEFLRILDFLTAQNARFLTPSECAAALQR